MLIGLAGALVFALGLAIDPAALLRMAYICGTGGCGVRPVWLATGFGILLGGWIVMSLKQRAHARRATRKRGRTGGRRKTGPAAKSKPASRRKASDRAKA